MTDSFDRRTFLGTAVAAVAAGTLAEGATPSTAGAAGAPWVRRSRAATFAAVASSNGIRGINLAVQMMQDGVDTLDAGVEGVKIQELDPDDTSVGYGGLPNEDGVVQLDASCMHGPTRRAGAVGALEGIKTPSEVARLVMKYTNHIMLVGEGAKRFALSYGFKDEDLMTDQTRQTWLRWRANRGPNDDYLDIPGGEDVWTHRPTGTVNINTINAAGDISSVTTTSGLAWKIPGRVGDSPIVGAGQYTDNEIGAAGSTGRGESNIMVCGGFLTVEHMRQGMSPTDACLATLRRVVAMTPPRLIDEAGKPRFNLSFYALNKRGETGSAMLYPGQYAAHDGREGRVLDAAYLYTR